MSITSPLSTRLPASAHPVRRLGALATVVSVAANAAVFGAARAFDVGFRFPRPGSAGQTQTVSMGSVLGTTLLATVVAWLVVGLVVSRHRPSLRNLTIIGAAIAVVSTAMPLSLNAPTATRLVLAAMHLITGAVFAALAKALRRSTQGQQL